MIIRSIFLSIIAFASIALGANTVHAIFAGDIFRPVLAQGNSTRTTRASRIYDPEFEDSCPIQMREHLWWRSQRWNMDESPYILAEKNIKARLARGESARTMAAGFRKLLDRYPKDSLVGFQWAFACWYAQKGAATEKDSRAICLPVETYLGTLAMPDSYRFARIGYLITAKIRRSLCLRGLGQRLLHRDPADEDVRFYYIRVLVSGLDPRFDKQAFEHLMYFRRKYPNVSFYELEYARLLERVWQRPYPLVRAKAEVAIAAYAKYLKRPDSAVNRKYVIARIQDIKEQQRGWELWGEKNWKTERARRRERINGDGR